MDLTCPPPFPSITLPVLTSTTLAWSQPPRKLSRRLPKRPHIVTAATHKAISFGPHAFPPRRPGSLLLNNLPEPTGQNGSRSAEVTAMLNEPSKPPRKPAIVTPPLVPGGTSRSLPEVISLGLLFERMPSSEENVSAATAA